jgi:hypothetical protein
MTALGRVLFGYRYSLFNARRTALKVSNTSSITATSEDGNVSGERDASGVYWRLIPSPVRRISNVHSDV